MYRERHAIVKKMMALVESYPFDEDMHKAVLDCLRAPNDCLPRLAEHLGRVCHDGTPESLLWAFHGPVSDDMDMRYRDALDEYIRRRLTAKDPLDPSLPLFIFDIDELSRAEAWLTLLERDGRRKK
jgi:hypothetical protein